MSASPARALDDLRVLDLSRTAAGAWCGRMLADFGASVLMVEPPAGHPLRAEAPFDDEGRSIPAELFLANRESIVLDLTTPAGRDTALALGRKCGIVISSFSPDELADLGLRYDDFGTPALIMAHVTPYGVRGPLANERGNELTVAARSGWASINGDAANIPLRPWGHQVGFMAGTAAYAAVLAAVHRRTVTGDGDEIDVAELDVAIGAFAPPILRGQYTGSALGRRAAADMTAGPVPVADGYFALTISRAHFWRDAMNLLGLHDLAEDSRWESSWYRAAHKDEYVGRVQAAMAGWTKADLFDELAARRVVAGPVLTMAELHENKHLRERGFWVEMADGDATRTFPGAPYRMPATPWELRRPAPAPGEHGEEWRQ